MSTDARIIRWFATLRLADAPLVGGKNAILGELHGQPATTAVQVPNGFALTAEACRGALTAADSWPRLHALLDGLDVTDAALLAERSRKSRRIVYDATGASTLFGAVTDAYRLLEAQYGANVAVAVRSSAIVEDLASGGLAGHHESLLNVSGRDDLFEACRLCFASMFTDRAIVHRFNSGTDHFKVALSVGVMKMVRSDMAASGTVITLDAESGFPDVVSITGAYGLGGNVIQGKVDPDVFHVHKATFLRGYRAVLRRSLGEKQFALRLADDRLGSITRDQVMTEAARSRFCIDDADVLTLADCALRIERHFGMPMAIEWAKDANDGRLYIVQARPETVAQRRSDQVFESCAVTGAGKVLVVGKGIGEKIGAGAVRVIGIAEDLKAFRPGEVLVASSTSPDWEPVMKIAGAIVTDHGGRTSHAAMVARQLGVPVVVGCEVATTTLRTGQRITVSCTGGRMGQVYEGDVPFQVERLPAGAPQLPRTPVMVSLGDPDLAFRAAMMPNAGVGLARMEFIMSEHIGVHPMAVVHPAKLTCAERARIAALSRNFGSPREFFVRTLAEGVGTIAAAFWPRAVTVRLSDFRSDGYAALLGGAAFEPQEANPLLGFRGASRYAHPAYADGFALECAALRCVREDMGLTNLNIMVPFCRRVADGEQVIEAMARHGLERGVDGLEIHVACALPSNVIQMDAFATVFDGFSIASDDLTQLTLGVDRNAACGASDFDERDPGMLEMLRLAVAGAKRNGRHVGICGEAPANHPEIARYLVELGIDSITVDPSSLLRTIAAARVAETGTRATAA